MPSPLLPLPTKRYAIVLISTLLLPLCLAATACRPRLAGTNRRDERRFALRSARRGLWNEALYRWKRLLAKNPDDPALHNNLAVTYEHEGRYEDAQREYDEAARLDPGNKWITRNKRAFDAFLSQDAAKQENGDAEGNKDEQGKEKENEKGEAKAP